MYTTPTIQHEVLEAVRLLKDDATFPKVCELLPERSKGTISSALFALRAAGEITAEKILGSHGTAFRYSINPNPVPARAKPKRRTPQPTSAGWQARLDAAKAQIAELEAWKQQAIARHPDLAVDPRILRARKIVANVLRKHNNDAHALSVERGEKDETPIMWATLEAMED